MATLSVFGYEAAWRLLQYAAALDAHSTPVRTRSAWMWFGVAPAPAPSPRTNTKAWHPPHCTCARHANANAPSSPRHAASVSPRRLMGVADDPSHQGHDGQSKKPEVSPRKRSLPRIGHRSVPRSSSPTSSRLREDGARNPYGASQDDEPQTPESAGSVGDNQRARRLSKRVASQQGDEYPTKEKEEQPERTLTPTEAESNNTPQLEGWPPPITLRPRSRTTTAVGASRDTPKYESFINAGDGTNTRLQTPSYGVVLPAIPAPSKSRRDSRGVTRTSETRRPTAGDAVQTPRLSLFQAEACVRLAPPMAERAQPTNLVGHTSSVGTVLVDEEHFIVTCSIDGSVKVWSRVSFSCLYTLHGHDDTVSCVDLSSQWLVSGSHDTTLRVYESGHGFRFVHSLEGHSGHVTRVKILTESFVHRDLVLSCSDDCSLRVWNVEVGVCLAVFRSHTSRITCSLVVPGAPMVVCSGSADTSVCFWDLTSLTNSAPLTTAEPRLVTSLRSFRVHKSTVQCLLSSSSCPIAGTEDSVFSCSNDGTIQWFNASTLQHVGCVDSVQSPIYSMAFHGTLGHLVCSTGDGRILIYSDWKTAIVKKELKVAPKWISSLQLLRGRLLACASEGDLYVVNLERPRIERVLTTAHGFLNCVRWLKPERLATSGEDNVVKIWSLF